MKSRLLRRARLATALCIVLRFQRLDSARAFQSGHRITMISSVPAKTALFYRDRYEHEQEHLTFPAPTSSTMISELLPSLQNPSSLSSSSTPSIMNDTEGGIHYGMLVEITFRQLTALLVTTLCALVGMGGHFADIFPASMHSSSSLSWFAACILGALSAAPLIYSQKWGLSQQRNLAAQQSQLRTNDLCDRMFGRRHCRPSQNESSSTTNLTTSTVTVLCLVAALTGLTAGVEEIIFRVYTVGSLLHHPALATPLNVVDSSGVAWWGILISAVAFGLVHTHPQYHRTENFHVASQQFACAIWYSCLLCTTGSLLVPVIAHWLYDWHTLAASWHTSNTQQDYVAEHTAATLDDPVATLFFAFDEQHCGTLSHRDVQHAVAFLFLDDSDSSVTPTVSLVEAELHRLAPNAHDDNGGVSLDVFRRLIYALHQNSQKHHKHQSLIAPPILLHHHTKSIHGTIFEVPTSI